MISKLIPRRSGASDAKVDVTLTVAVAEKSVVRIGHHETVFVFIRHGVLAPGGHYQVVDAVIVKIGDKTAVDLPTANSYLQTVSE